MTFECRCLVRLFWLRLCIKVCFCYIANKNKQVLMNYDGSMLYSERVRGDIIVLLAIVNPIWLLSLHPSRSIHITFISSASIPQWLTYYLYHSLDINVSHLFDEVVTCDDVWCVIDESLLLWLRYVLGADGLRSPISAVRWSDETLAAVDESSMLAIVVFSSAPPYRRVMVMVMVMVMEYGYGFFAVLNGV